MATLYISEYAVLPTDANGRVLPLTQEPALAEQSVTIAGASAQSAAFNAATKYVMIHTDVACSVLFGANPTAVAASKRMAAGETRFHGVTPGHKVAVITNS